MEWQGLSGRSSKLKGDEFESRFEIYMGSSVDRLLESRLPKEFSLSQNYPNPYNPVTTIGYSLAEDSEVSLKVYDILGREVASLVEGHQVAGKYTLILNSSSWSSGLYIYRIKAGNFIQTKKMILIK